MLGFSSSCSWWKPWSKLVLLVQHTWDRCSVWLFLACAAKFYPSLGLSPVLAQGIAVLFLPLAPCFSAFKFSQGWKVVSPGRKSQWPSPPSEASPPFHLPYTMAPMITPLPMNVKPMQVETPLALDWKSSLALNSTTNWFVWPWASHWPPVFYL